MAAHACGRAVNQSRRGLHRGFQILDRNGALLSSVTLNGFWSSALLGGAQNMMLPEFIIQQVQSFLNWGLASAGAALLIVITLVLFYFYLKLQPESPVGASNAR